LLGEIKGSRQAFNRNLFEADRPKPAGETIALDGAAKF